MPLVQTGYTPAGLDPDSVGMRRFNSLLQGGATLEQAQAWAQRMNDAALRSGAKPEDIARYWGVRDPNMDDLAQHILANFGSAPLDVQAKIAQDPWQALMAGWDHGSLGLLAGRPDWRTNENAGLFSSIMSSLGESVGDIAVSVPAIFGGAAAGIPEGGFAGAAAGGAIGAAVPAAIRASMIDHYEKGDILTSRDLLSRAAGIALSTAKAAGVGAITLIGGKAGGELAERYLPELAEEELHPLLRAGRKIASTGAEAAAAQSGAEALTGAGDVSVEGGLEKSGGKLAEGLAEKLLSEVAGPVARFARTAAVKLSEGVAASIAGTSAAAAMSGGNVDARDFIVNGVLGVAGTAAFPGSRGAAGVEAETAPVEPNPEASSQVGQNLRDIYRANGAPPGPVIQAAATNDQLRAEVAAPVTPDGDVQTPLLKHLVAPQEPPRIEGREDMLMPGAAEGPFPLSEADAQIKADPNLALQMELNFGPGHPPLGPAPGMTEAQADAALEHHQLAVLKGLGAPDDPLPVGEAPKLVEADGTPVRLDENGEPVAPEEAEHVAGGGGGGLVPPGGRHLAWDNGEPEEVNAAREHILSKISAVPVKGRWPDWLNWHHVVTTFQSALAPDRRVDRLLASTTGDDTHQGVEDWHRQTYASATRANMFLTEGTLRYNPDQEKFEVSSDDSFYKALRDVAQRGGDAPGWTAFRMAARAMELNLRGIKKIPFDLAKVETLLGSADRAKYLPGMEIMRRSSEALIQYAIDGDFLSPKQGENILKKNMFYVSFRRLMDPDYTPPIPSGAAWRVQEALKALQEKGSERNILDPNTTQVENVHAIVSSTDFNRYKLFLTDQILAHNAMPGSTKIDLDVQPGALRAGEPTPDNPTQFGGLLGHAAGTDLAEQVAAEAHDETGAPLDPEEQALAAKLIAHRMASKALRPDQYMFYRKGVRYIATSADRNVLDIIKGFDTSLPNNWMTGIANMFARYQRSGIGVMPDFIARAFTHNQISQSVFSPHPSFPFEDLFVHGLPAMLGKRWGSEAQRATLTAAWQEAQANGILGTELARLDKNYLQDGVHRILEETGAYERGWNVASNVWHLLGTVHRVYQATTGFGHYLRLRGSTALSPARIAMEGRKTNFDYAEGFGGWAGRGLNTLARMTTFMATGFKDLDQIYTAFRDRPLTTAARVLAQYSLSSMALAALNNHVSEGRPAGYRYQDQPRWKRDAYWFIPLPGNQWFTVRKPYAAAFAFTAIPERFVDWLWRENPHAFDGLLDSMKNDVVPPFVPSVIVPAAEQIFNTNFYTGQPLLSPGLANHYAPELQYKPDTTNVALKLTQLLGPANANIGAVSPVVIDNYIRQWGGTATYEAIRYLGGTASPQAAGWESNIFAKSFLARNPEMSSQGVQDFFDDMTKLKGVNDDVRSLLETGALPPGSAHELPSYERAAANRQTYQEVLTLARVEHTLWLQTQVIRGVEANPDLTRDEKLVRVDAWVKQAIAVAGWADGRAQALLKALQ